MSLKPRGLHFGAGNIGRGFIAPLLLRSGYHVVFADVDKDLIDTINRDKSYDVHILDSTTEGADNVEEVNRVKGVLATTDDILSELAHPKLKLITTAVGPPVLAKIAPTIAKGIKARREAGAGVINIVACENAIGATTQLEEHIHKHLEEEDKHYISVHVGFANCSVDRIVPPFDPHSHDGPTESVLDVGVENFFEWVVDAKPLKPNSGLEVPIKGMTLTEHLPAYNERKLFTLNCGHAVTAYLGHLKGHTTIADSIADPEILSIVQGALHNESGKALCKRHSQFEESQHKEYINTILRRFANEAVKDDVVRVGRQPLRKLGKDDRLVGPTRLCVEYGIVPAQNLAMGIAAALRYSNDDDEQSVEMQSKLRDLGVEAYITELTGWQKEEDATKSVVEAYHKLERWINMPN
ncbi:Mannitol dehydrogenase domain-containing protein [Mycena indigotica]|uniref:Mannitol-1-phosphate 5-dehydrogenase n=1 Tax=Mycena indigotica TaxID=2126181 RepID=A0A8H6T375_9AGAR|nr:Mannitol dehydrogenase domain-containing protein [Mycena indigotica]KAF7310069.1 Mannitol dehydrogenase domain-containing protein [Mycena indigotica]